VPRPLIWDIWRLVPLGIQVLRFGYLYYYLVTSYCASGFLRQVENGATCIRCKWMHEILLNQHWNSACTLELLFLRPEGAQVCLRFAQYRFRRDSLRR
jgi:hypothetical protein